MAERTFRGFYFKPLDFFLRILLPYFFSSFVWGKSAQTKSSRKIPVKILQNLSNENPRRISAEAPGHIFGGSDSGCQNMQSMRALSQDVKGLAPAAANGEPGPGDDFAIAYPALEKEVEIGEVLKLLQPQEL